MSDEEEQVLLQDRSAFLGLRFQSEEHKALILKLLVTSAVQFFCSLVLVGIAMDVGKFRDWWGGGLMDSGHIHHHRVLPYLLSVLLPFIAYYGVLNTSAICMYVFEMGSLVFALLHSCVWVLVFTSWSTAREVTSEYCAEAASVKQCQAEVVRIQDTRAVLFVAWTLVTLPMWVSQLHAAYLSHEYYFQLRVHKLVIKPVGDFALVQEDGTGRTRPVRYAEDIDGVE